MGKCNTEQVLSMIGVNKLTKTQELFFSVLQDNDSCVKLKPVTTWKSLETNQHSINIYDQRMHLIA